MDNKVGEVHTTRRKAPENSNRLLCKFFRRKYRQIVAIFVRCLLLIHSTMAVWLLVSMKGNKLLWCLLVVNVLLVMETVFTVVKREGKESRWFCPAFLAYLTAVLPPVWMVELDHLEHYNEALVKSNLTLMISITGTNGAELTVPVKLEPEVWVSAIEQTLLFLLVVCRWLLPRGNTSREELSQLLFVFMGIASDSVELFEVFDEPDVRTDRTLTCVTLGIWSLSLLQFVFVLTSTSNPKSRAAVLHHQRDEDTEIEKVQTKEKPYIPEVMVTTEIWSLLFSVLVQDGPYAGIRIYAMMKYNILNHSIIFFICKNFLIISLVLYRFLILCIYRNFMADDTDDEDKDIASVKSSKKTAGSKSLLSNTRNIKVKPTSVTSHDSHANITVKPASVTTRDNDANITVKPISMITSDNDANTKVKPISMTTRDNDANTKVKPISMTTRDNDANITVKPISMITSDNDANTKVKPISMTTRDNDANTKVKPISMTTRDNGANTKVKPISMTTRDNDANTKVKPISMTTHDNDANTKVKPISMTTRNKDANIKVKPISMITSDNDADIKVKRTSVTSRYSDTNTKREV